MICRAVHCAAPAAVLSLCVASGASAQGCPGDVNNDGRVSGIDMTAILADWGPGGFTEFDTDINNDGRVDGFDLTAVLAGWGPCPGVPAWATVLQYEPNPAEVHDPAVRAAISAAGRPWRVRDIATQIEMVLIPPGTFDMGCSASVFHQCSGDGSESPVHPVTLTSVFYMGRYEVTQAQWTARMGSNPSFFQGASAEVPASQVPTRPVERVSWNDIQGFLAATGMRLPTEAEWEYAYRAGTTTAFHSMPLSWNGTNDDTLLSNIAWWGADSSAGGNSAGQTRPVGQKFCNGFGLYDMSGNVWEWVNDWHSATYYVSSPSVNPPGPGSGETRCLRGGGWANSSFSCRSSTRGKDSPSVGASTSGFRVARNP